MFLELDRPTNRLTIREASCIVFFEMIEVGRYQSGQMGQTVNLLAYAFGGSNPPLPTKTYDLPTETLQSGFFLLPSHFRNYGHIGQVDNGLKILDFIGHNAYLDKSRKFPG